jgi:hypothetical protein
MTGWGNEREGGVGCRGGSIGGQGREAERERLRSDPQEKNVVEPFQNKT